MMMTEKYHTLPPPSSSPSSSSLFYHSSIRDRKARLYPSRKSTEMKLLIEPSEQQAIVRTYSSYDVQDRIDYFEKKKQFDNQCEENVLVHSLSSSSTDETLQTVLANTLQQTFLRNESYGSALSRTMMNSTVNSTNKRRTYSSSQILSLNDSKRSTRYCSLLSKRVRTYSLSNHATMAIAATTSFSEEQTTEPHETTTMDYENTYFYPEETTRLDDALSLTTITPNLLLQPTKEIDICSDTTVSQSDSEDTSEELTPIIKQYNHTYVINPESSFSYENIQNNIERQTSNVEQDFTGLVHARKCRIVEEKSCLSTYDNVNHSCEENNFQRSKADNLSLNQLITSSIEEEDHCRTNSIDISSSSNQQQNKRRTNVINQYTLVHPIDMTNEHDGNSSDASNSSSEDFRYSSDAARNSCTSDDLNNTSSTLRQEAISITRVRCKRRKTWIRSPSSPTQALTNIPLQQRRLKTALIEPFLSTHSIAGTDVRPTVNVNSTDISKTALSTPLNQTRVKAVTATMLLHNNSLNCQKNGESLSYDFISTNTDHHESSSSSLKISNTLDKDTSSPKTNKNRTEFYQPSLSPVKRLLNESIDSNIEVIQMDEQECILEIVDGVLTIVPKDKSNSSSSSTSADSLPKKHDASKSRKQRSSSAVSSVSTPSLSEQDQEREAISSKPLPIEQSLDILDLFSTPNNPPNSNTKTLLLDDSLSSVSSYGERPMEIKKSSTSSSILRSSSPINHSNKSSSIKDTSSSTIENQTRSNKSSLLTQLLQTVKKASPTAETEPEKSPTDSSFSKPASLPKPRPINKDRINEFASLLSSSVHLSQPQLTSKPPATKTSTSRRRSSPVRSDGQNSLPTSTSEQEPIKRHIDARYTEKLDDRGSIKINTANIKALFEQKISDTNKALSQSSEHLTHLPETRSQHKKVPVSYRVVKKDLPPTVSSQSSRRRSYQEPSTMNKFPEQINTTKDVVIEDKQSENGVRRHTADHMIRSNSPVSVNNGHSSESLIAREIRETKEKEEELKRQRKKCGLEDEHSTIVSSSTHDSIKSESNTAPPKSSSFLSNLDFFTSKLHASSTDASPMMSSSPRRSTIATQNLVFDLPNSSRDEFKQMNNVVSQELNRFNENGVPILRTSSTNGLLQRSASNQNILASTQTNNNIVQREIEAIRMKEAELRQLGRIQHTSDEHADPRKYQELVSVLPKSQSINTIPAGKKRRDSENQYVSRQNGPIMPMSNGFVKSNPNNSVRGKFPNANPSIPVVSSSKKTVDYSKLSSTDRLEFEKRQCQEREQELRKQRHSIGGSSSSTNTTINGDSGNVSQEEHDDEQERYFDKIERLKRTENAKAQAPLIRPTKKFDMSQKWEQMMANKLDD